ncbi:hypothetical protein BDN70DRAFT_859672 [Pholiota conissans]|uniref:Uncharacterized protein n=1 Tax=Pholiota conissans TaxID=109636 RepID=A0A9P5YZJ0_9AGAR|nr:hypothetical protein BDN70DRAFT_859672 [Pholiota conissans]
MILLITLFLTLTRGAPLSSGSVTTFEPTYALLALRDAASQNSNDRTILDIIWSCLLTIFACTWSSFHPNIPGPYDSGWRSMKRRVVTTFYALIAPEVVAMWVLKQYMGARLIANEGRSAPWTMTHAFFVQMGGFLLCKDGKPIQVLDYARLKRCIADGTMDPPDITADEIKDRSKGDFISKGLAVLQTSWFLLQCITRWSQKLPLSELEVLTLGFAAMNGITYALWWNKPQDVGKAFRIEKKISFKSPPISTLSHTDAAIGMDSLPAPVPAPQSSPTSSLPPQAERRQSQSLSSPEFVKVKFLPLAMANDYAHVDGSWRNLLWFYAVRIPIRLIQFPLWVIAKMIRAGGFDVHDGAIRMPMFASEHLAYMSYGDLWLATCVIGSFFGGIHLIAWSSPFPSRTEQLLWRISALYIAACPIGIIIGILVFNVGTTIVWVYAVLYGFARAVLIFEVMFSLRNLPQGVYQDVQWTMFIPHL